MKNHSQTEFSSSSFKHSYLTEESLLQETAKASLEEKTATLVLLEYLLEVDRRRTYAGLGFSSLFEYVHRELGYSESQTSERVNAVRLMRGSGSVKEHLEKGQLTLTSASQIQRYFQMEKRVTESLPETKKEEIIEQCLNLSKREVERAKEVTQHQSLANLFDRALSALIEKQEKKMGRVFEEEIKNRLSTLPAVQPKQSTIDEKSTTKENSISPDATAKKQNNSRHIPASFKRVLYQRSQGQCEYIHPTTHQRCRSGDHLQIDHIQPIALNGKTVLKNLRHLCHAHNQHAATRAGFSRTIPSTTQQENICS